MWAHSYVVSSLVGVQSATHLNPEFASPRVTLPPCYSSFPTNAQIDFVISFASKVVALMNVLAARRSKRLPTEKGTDPTLSH